MKPRNSSKIAKKTRLVEHLRFARDFDPKTAASRRNTRKVGTETELPPGTPIAKSYVVQIVTPETLAAGFPFGLRFEVFAETPQLAASQASDDFRRLSSFIREQARAGFVEEISRCLGVN